MSESAVAVAGTAIAVVMVVPQLVRVRRHGVAGISGAAAGCGALNAAGWVLYAVATGRWPLAVASAVPATGSALVAGVVLVCAGAGRWLAIVVGWAAVLGVCAAVGGWSALGVALGASVAVSYAPQVVAAWRCADLAGLSPGTWLLAGAEGVLWGAFGLVISDVALVLWGTVATCGSVAVLSGWWRWRRARG